MKYVVILLVMAGLTACEAGENFPLGPTGPDASVVEVANPPDASAFEVTNPIVASVTGAGHFVQEEESGHFRRLTVNARVYADGTVNGQMQLNGSTLGATHGAVTCLTVVDNRAYVGGVYTFVQNLDAYDFPIIGTEFVFLLEDRGQGVDDPPDLLSLAYFGIPDGSAAEFCRLEGRYLALLQNQELNPVERGNFQVTGD